MMKRVLILVLAVFCVCISFASLVSAAEAPFHIGVMTATVSQSEDDLRGAQALIAKIKDPPSSITGYLERNRAALCAKPDVQADVCAPNTSSAP